MVKGFLRGRIEIRFEGLLVHFILPMIPVMQTNDFDHANRNRTQLNKGMPISSNKIRNLMLMWASMATMG